MFNDTKYVLGILLSFFMVSESFAVGASGFATQFVGAKAMGQANTFVAEADDPSAVYFNPAGLTQLKETQVTVGLAGMIPFGDRSGNGVPDDRMKREATVQPNFFAGGKVPVLNDKMAAGICLFSPFGMSTDWAPTSSVRYVSTVSQFEMLDTNPSVAYEVSPAVSLGAGVDYVNLMNTISQSQTNQAGANDALTGTIGDASPDGTSKLSGHGSGWGYNVGALYKPLEKHSFGASYRSQVRIPIRGSIELSNLSATTQNNFNFATSNYSADATTSIILPASAILGYAYKPTDQWTLLADYEWTQWNTFQNQDIAINESDPGRLAFLTGDPTNNVSSVQRHWHNVSAGGVGANFMANKAWQLRGGYAYFEKTAPNDTFSPDIPDASIHLLALGLSRSWDSVVLDFAFHGYFYVNRTVNNTVGNTSGATVNGTYKNFTPVLGLNATYKFGK